MLETTRREINARRLAQLNPKFAAKVRAVIGDLESHGMRPLIATGYRSIADQKLKKAQGYSTVSFGLHNCATKDGKPDSLAVDIVDADLGWNAPRSFWLKLTSAFQAHGLESGAYWFKGLLTTKRAKRAKLKAAIDAKKWDSKEELGWDVAHGQWPGISPVAARLGKRP